MKILKNIICGIVLGAVILPLSSCKLVDWVNQQDMVVTTLSQVQKGQRAEAVILPTDEIPEKYREAWKDKTVVLTPQSSLLEDATFVPVSTESSSWDSNALVSLAQGALSVGSTFIPQLAGFEALLILLFKRKRKHYGNALKAIAPTGQGINIKAASQSIGKALGMAHSSTGSGETFDKEEMKSKKA